MKPSINKERAAKFLALHLNPPILRLANAWDVTSAKIFELANFEAIGTTSSGIAHSWGYPDGEVISLAELLMVVRRIAGNISVPLSVDLEAGYGSSPEEAARSVEQIIDAGAVGINLEDVERAGDQSLVEISQQLEKISAIRQLADKKEFHLVINARTDIFLRSEDPKPKQMEQVIERGNKFKEAGADCIFIVGTGGFSNAELASLVNEINAPINLFVGPKHPPINQLEEMGVARLSFGGQAMRSAYAKLAQIAKDMIETGDLSLLFEEALSEQDLQNWFS